MLIWNFWGHALPLSRNKLSTYKFSRLIFIHSPEISWGVLIKGQSIFSLVITWVTLITISLDSISGLSLRARGRGFSLATISVALGYFFGNRRKMEPKEIPSCLIPHLLAVFTQQLEVLVTSLTWILLGENSCWSLVALKGLKICRHSDLMIFFYYGLFCHWKVAVGVKKPVFFVDCWYFFKLQVCVKRINFQQVKNSANNIFGDLTDRSCVTS